MEGLPEVYPAYFEPPTEASPQTRLNCVFVDFKEGQWINGCKISRDRLVLLITYLEHVLEKMCPEQKGLSFDDLFRPKTKE